MIQKEIIYAGRTLIAACDGLCTKAWGVDSRPEIELDKNNPDDYAYLADNELGEAPVNPGTYEGPSAKPLSDEPKFNKWCVRQCERCDTFSPNEEIVLPDFSKRKYNIPSLHSES